MAPIQAPVLYTETRLDLKPASSTSIVELPCTATGGQVRSPKRAKHSHSPSHDLDEATFAQTHLASASSIFFRRKSRSPRAFLWRVLSGQKILEIQAVDLVQDKGVSGDAVLTLRFHFDAGIRPFGIALADPDEKDALVAFVITEANELFTLTLRREMWMDKRRTETEIETEQWCKVFSPSVFSFRSPYRLFAISALELVVSLQDGGLLKLQRGSGEDGAHWRDTFFTEGGWGSTLKGLIGIKSQNRIPFGNNALEPNTAAVVGLSPDGQHYMTVGLDHWLRAWNLQTGKVGLQTDLLGDNEIPERKIQYLIGAEQGQLLQLIDGPGSNGVNYWAITYSPKQHQFKIWGILDADSGLAGIRDETDGVQLIPPLEELMDTSVWSMEEFHFAPKHHWRETDLWVRVRSGPTSKVLHLRFDLSAEPEDQQVVWRYNWVAVDGGTLSLSQLDKAAPPALEPLQEASYITPTQRWIEFLFQPGRVDSEVLRAALGVYSRPTKQHRANSKLLKPLKQRICEAVVSTAQKQYARISASGETFDSTVATQWRVFWSLVRDLLKRQAESLSLAYDAEDGLPWLVRSGFVAPIRTFSDIEALRHNNTSNLLTLSQSPRHPLAQIVKDEDDGDVTRLLHAAKGMHSSLPTQLRSSLLDRVTSLILEDPSDDVPTRIQGFEEALNLCAQISDEEWDRLTGVFNDLGGIQTVGDNMFHTILDKLGEQMQGLPIRTAIARFGAKALIRGAQDTIEAAIETILELLLLVVFLSEGLEPGDLSPQLHTADLFVELTTQLKEHLLLKWLATTLRPSHIEPKHRKRRSSGRDANGSLMDSSTTEEVTPELEPTVAETVMESIFIGDWSSISTPQDGPSPALLTYWCRAWTYGLDIGNHYDEIASHVLAHLVRYGDVDLAQRFTKFVTLTPWSGYVLGRLALLNGDYHSAARLFRKSSFGLALSHFDTNDISPSLLLQPHEKNYFSDGLAAYYTHILALFQSEGAHSYVIECANLGLQAIASPSQSAAERQSQQSELKARLFAACMATSRFDGAYACLNDMPPALRKASLSTFLTSLLSHDNASIASETLKRLPLTSTYADADAILESLAMKTLAVASGQGARFFKALYALRVSRGDMRGAATALWNRIVRLRSSTERVADPESAESRELLRCYLTLINCLACVEPSQSWIFTEAKVAHGQGRDSSGFGGDVDPAKPRTSLTLGPKNREGKERSVLTLQDVRTAYQRELDRIEAVSAGRYAFDGGEGGDGMDVL